MKNEYSEKIPKSFIDYWQRIPQSKRDGGGGSLISTYETRTQLKY